MTGLVFVDTNVLLYRADRDEPVKRLRANDWIDHLWREKTGRTSMQVLSEFYANLRRKGGTRAVNEESWSHVQPYFAWKPLAIDGNLLLRAHEVERRWRLSWWDSMVVAAAQLQDCALLLTEDLQDGAQFGAVTVRSPFTLDVREAAAAYAALPPAVPRHRPRGRPAKRAAAPR
jgi:predicted nucleic acid-binding protein